MSIDTIVDLIAKVGTPLAILYLGISTTRYVATVKEKVSLTSDFNKQWADDFYKTSSEYLRCLEKCSVYFYFITHSQNKNDELGRKMQEETNALLMDTYEYNLSIRRFSFLSPMNKDELVQSSQDIQDYLVKISRERVGSLDELISLQNRFNACSRKAHSEMLKI